MTPQQLWERIRQRGQEIAEIEAALKECNSPEKLARLLELLEEIRADRQELLRMQRTMGYRD